jgi:uncharacterized lipoprotein YmbA
MKMKTLTLSCSLALILIACSPVPVAPEKRWVLPTESPVALTARIPTNTSPRVWQLMPVRLPAYMNQDALLLPTPSNAARWAELPSESAQRILAADLAAIVGASHIWNGTVPSGINAQPLRVEVQSFDVSADGRNIQMQARWSAGTQVHQVALTSPVAEPARIAELVQAHRVALARLAQAVAATL